MRWLVCDTLSTPEQFFCSHLSAYSHYLREYGETVDSYCLNLGGVFGPTIIEGDVLREVDVVFALDRYDRVAKWREMPAHAGAKFVAQCAAITNPLPWEVRKPDGLPAFDLVISSIPWMVDAARAAGCRSEYMALAFDLRARVCMMGVKRDIDCLFIGSTGGNHVRRTQLLEELKDVVTVLPPVFGREYFKTIARAKTVFDPHAEWCGFVANNMRAFESAGLGAIPLIDCAWPGGVRRFGTEFDGTVADARASIRWSLAERKYGVEAEAIVLQHHTYECATRIPRLVELARAL